MLRVCVLRGDSATAASSARARAPTRRSCRPPAASLRSRDRCSRPRAARATPPAPIRRKRRHRFGSGDRAAAWTRRECRWRPKTALKIEKLIGEMLPETFVPAVAVLRLVVAHGGQQGPEPLRGHARAVRGCRRRSAVRRPRRPRPAFDSVLRCLKSQRHSWVRISPPKLSFSAATLTCMAAISGFWESVLALAIVSRKRTALSWASPKAATEGTRGGRQIPWRSSAWPPAPA